MRGGSDGNIYTPNKKKKNLSIKIYMWIDILHALYNIRPYILWELIMDIKIKKNLIIKKITNTKSS